MRNKRISIKNKKSKTPSFITQMREEDKQIAYFSMEIGLDSSIRTYSGGLGILAGDTVRSCADLKVPMVAVSLLYRKGYFYQKLDKLGNQKELPYKWNHRRYLSRLKKKVSVTIEGKIVYIQPWVYVVKGASGGCVPVIFLDTDIKENNKRDRSLTHYLYGGDKKYRLSQEIILGVGGVRMLKELGFYRLNRYHMNEGHASLLALELLKQRKHKNKKWDIDRVRRMCVFTTHTPVPAGHDQFDYKLVKKVLGDFVPITFLKSIAGKSRLNMTRLALNLSHYVNGVAKRHMVVSREMFPGYHIESITNGVHAATWTNDNFKKLYDTYIPGWFKDPFSLRYALNIPKNKLWDSHQKAKKALITYVNKNSKIKMDYKTFTIGFARRATAYKRADLVFFDTDRLIQIAKNVGKLQFVFSGIAHPKDLPGKKIIKHIFNVSRQFSGILKIVYLEHYDIKLAKMITSGVDLWLNTPRKPQEASGTSGMKAALNGIPSLSILDGWWIEGWIEGLTGWAIDSVRDVKSVDKIDAQLLYKKLERVIIPTFYNNRELWTDIMRHSIAINASFFNTHRMVQQYVLNAYSY